MWQVIAWSIGLIAQLVGVSIALVGVLATQRDYKADDEAWMLDWMFDVGGRIAKRWSALVKWTRRTFTRRRAREPVIVHAATGRASVTATLSGRAQVLHSPLPDTMPLCDKLRILDQRVQQDNRSINRLEDEAVEDRKQVADLRDQLDKRAAELRRHADESVRTYATRGVKASAWGLFITAAGMLVSAFAQPPWTH